MIEILNPSKFKIGNLVNVFYSEFTFFENFDYFIMYPTGGERNDYCLIIDNQYKYLRGGLVFKALMNDGIFYLMFNEQSYFKAVIN